MAVATGITMHQDLFHIVFMTTLISVSIQGGMLPLVAKKLKMIDDNPSFDNEVIQAHQKHNRAAPYPHGAANDGAAGLPGGRGPVGASCHLSPQGTPQTTL